VYMRYSIFLNVEGRSVYLLKNGLITVSACGLQPYFMI
jgi:hypothetical protein